MLTSSIRHDTAISAIPMEPPSCELSPSLAKRFSKGNDNPDITNHVSSDVTAFPTGIG